MRVCGISARHGNQRRCFGSFHTSLCWNQYSMLHALGPATTSVGEYVAPALPKNLAPSEYIGTSLNECSHPVWPSMMKPKSCMKWPPSEVSLRPTVRDASAIHCRSEEHTS